MNEAEEMLMDTRGQCEAILRDAKERAGEMLAAAQKAKTDAEQVLAEVALEKATIRGEGEAMRTELRMKQAVADATYQTALAAIAQALAAQEKCDAFNSKWEALMKSMKDLYV